LGDWFPLQTYFLTSKASPNDSKIVIVVIIIVIGEAKLVLHDDGIIAQTIYLDRALIAVGLPRGLRVCSSGWNTGIWFFSSRSKLFRKKPSQANDRRCGAHAVVFNLI